MVVAKVLVSLNDALLRRIDGIARSRRPSRSAHLAQLARWAAPGLTAYDPAYVTLAEAEAILLNTDAGLIVAVAPRPAFALAERPRVHPTRP